MKIFKPIVALAAALAAAGCISTSDFEAAQRQISELQEELANIKRTASSKDEVQNVNVRIAEQTETLLKSNDTLVAKVSEIEERIQNTQGSFEQGAHRLDQVAQQVAKAQRDVDDLKARIAALQATPPPVAANTGGGVASGEMTVPATPNPSVDPMQTYQAAYRDYQRGNFDLAIEGFQDFLDGSPNSDLADNAAYWIGESLFSQKKYHEAIRQFDAVVNKYPKSDKVPGALLKKGYAYINVNERAQGVVQLQYVLHEHPRSQEASLAKQKLKQLGIETK
ncbi:MAG TPA: tol-pal system protein YbgF [Thermoanaerobaculia bacterium]|jgi:tol-pal system protein YbgF|nr:tol-pal system protein YbgF [Thermoanaerobaculia bacterium]